MRTAEQALHVCPLCHTPVKDGQLGLRDYRRLTALLPDRVGATDLDFVLEQNSSGRVLVIEFKPAGERVGLGQRLTLRRLVRAGFDVWVVWEKKGTDSVAAAVVDRSGNTAFIAPSTVDGHAKAIRDWWSAG